MNPPVPDSHVTRVHPLELRYSNGEQAMPRGRQPEGETTLSNAERQARYRARHKDDRPTPIVRVRYRRPADRRSRPQRWDDAVAELFALQAEFVAWHDALPEGFRDTATAEALRAIAELDLTELLAIIPPRGFGRD
jgi:lysophospholipase L1-like esterase